MHLVVPSSLGRNVHQDVNVLPHAMTSRSRTTIQHQTYAVLTPRQDACEKFLNDERGIR